MFLATLKKVAEQRWVTSMESPWKLQPALLSEAGLFILKEESPTE